MGKKLKRTTEEFIEEAKKIHGNLYDYCFFIYKGINEKNKIICNIHGEFWQSPHDHLKGRGCPLCGRQNIGLKSKLSQEEFIKRAINIHGNNFCYTESIYIGMHKPIKIICKSKRHITTPKAHDHLFGYGCLMCYHEVIGDRNRKSTHDFIKEASIIHHNKYDYSKVIYKNNNTKVDIICYIHGTYKQTPDNHLNGHACPKCCHSISKPEMLWLDSLSIPEEYRQKVLYINNKKINTDAYDPITNTIYEFNGDFWHGNPKKYNADAFNKVVKKTFGELYNKTVDRENLIKQAGYNIVSIWESDFNAKLK
jgi:hypothetical protein